MKSSTTLPLEFEIYGQKKTSAYFFDPFGLFLWHLAENPTWKYSTHLQIQAFSLPIPYMVW